MDERELLLRIEKASKENAKILDLSNIELTSLPSEIGRLGNLECLYLNDTRLASLPPEIGQLGKLEVLYLSNAGLTTLPPEIRQLDKLKVLDIRGNRLTSLPSEIGQLSSLTTLYLKNTRLTSLPPEIGQLSSLQYLDISGIGLASLPLEIGQLSSLEQLDISNNRLTSLPPESSRLTKLRQIELDGNPLPPIPPEIQASGVILRIIAFYSGYARATAKPLNEAKVLLLGQGKVGKTSLVKRLRWNTFDPDESKTDGIDIHRWSVTADSENIRLNLWDFGGQEIMHATHQFFLTRRSLYLLVLDARLDEGENRVDYWLRIIRSFGGDSPVIVVGNQVDQHPLDINRSRLRARHPNVKAILETLPDRRGDR